MKTFIKSIVLISTVLAIAFTIESCNSAKPIDKAQLDGYWILKTMNGQEAAKLFEGTLPSMEFNFTDSLITGNAGCNNYNGKFSMNEKNEFSAPQLAMTMMLCPQANQESEFTKILGEKSVISIESNGMLTFKQDDKVIFQFEKGERPVITSSIETATPELIMGSWTLKTMPGEDIKVLFADNKPTAEFDTLASKISGSAGCNSYSTSYKLENGVLTLGPVITTKMACPSLEGENKLIKLLETPFEASINDGDLTLSKNGSVVITFFKNDQSAK